MEITRRTPGKVNLCLLVGPRDETGYHELFTVFAPVDLCDTIEFTLDARPSSRVLEEDAVPPVHDHRARLAVECGAVAGEANLAAKALRALEHATGWAFEGKVVIHKRIPVGAGMGGGSSDAAAALRVGAEVVAAAGGPLVDDRQLALMARGLGADVPFFLNPTPSIARGIGDDLEPIALPPFWMALVTSQRTLSTAQVYAKLDELRPGESRAMFGIRSNRAERRWRGVTDVNQAAGLLENDLEQASFTLIPSLAADRELLVREGALGALMSGSGPTLFGLCASREKAEELRNRMETRGYTSRVAALVGGDGD